jgi:hypothetical protein
MIFFASQNKESDFNSEAGKCHHSKPSIRAGTYCTLLSSNVETQFANKTTQWLNLSMRQ